MSWFLNILRWILYCGDDDDARALGDHHYAALARQDARTPNKSPSVQRSPVVRPPEAYSSSSSWRDPPRSSSRPPVAVAVAPPSKATPTTTNPSISSKTCPSPLPSSICPPSKAKPAPNPLPRTIKASLPSPSIPPPSKPSPTPRPPSKATTPTPRPPPPISSSRSEYADKSPELLDILHKRLLPRYEIPKHLKELIQKDKVPPVLMAPVSPSTYADYFASLLYAEDYYQEKWSDFILSEVTLDLRSWTTSKNAREIMKTNNSVQTNKKVFVAFDIGSVPGRRPFLLSRDFVFVRPSGKMIEPFKGILFRVVKSTSVLVEFKDDFYAQHSSTKKYDVSFSFNRVCFKRSHHAISAAKDPSMHNILFPDVRSSLSFSYSPPASQILNHEGPLPYLIEGPRSTTPSDQLSSTGSSIQDAILQIYRTVPHCRILICAPKNLTCDVLMRSFQKEIPLSKLFRANAAFREYDLVPGDIIPSCLYKGECFTCPPLSELRDFKVVTSTFMSSFRLHNAGISAHHFTHVFLVDASSATEPEAVVALAYLVSKKTVLVVTGSSTDHPWSVRSDIARKHGLSKSYFHRLLEREPYSSRDIKFITRLV